MYMYYFILLWLAASTVCVKLLAYMIHELIQDMSEILTEVLIWKYKHIFIHWWA